MGAKDWSDLGVLEKVRPISFYICCFFFLSKKYEKKSAFLEFFAMVLAPFKKPFLALFGLFLQCGSARLYEEPP